MVFADRLIARERFRQTSRFAHAIEELLGGIANGVSYLLLAEIDVPGGNSTFKS